MSALVPTNIQLPAAIAARVGAPSSVASAMASGFASGIKRISVRGGRFRVRDGKQETILPGHSLRAIIVGASSTITKQYYKGSFNPNADDNKGPDCYSTDGVRPAANAPDPQAQLCATCPNNAWDSKVSESGQKMKACADQKRLAIISADDHSDEPEVYLFTVTPSALGNFRNYASQLASKGWPPEYCVTEIAFDPNTSYPKATFSFKGFVEESRLPVLDTLVKSERVREATGEDEVQAIELNTTVEKPKPAAIKIIEDAEYTVVETPPPAKGFGTAAPASKPAPAKAEPVVVKGSNLQDDIQDILKSMEASDD